MTIQTDEPAVPKQNKPRKFVPPKLLVTINGAGRKKDRRRTPAAP